jgi:dynein heavy chain
MRRVLDEAQLDQNKLNIDDIQQKMTEEKGPYQNVFLQECEVMNTLINEILRSLAEI